MLIVVLLVSLDKVGFWLNVINILFVLVNILESVLLIMFINWFCFLFKLI